MTFPVWHWSEVDLALNTFGNLPPLLAGKDSDDHPPVFAPPFRSAVAFEGLIGPVTQHYKSVGPNPLVNQIVFN